MNLEDVPRRVHSVDIDVHQRRPLVIAAVIFGAVFTGCAFLLTELLHVPKEWRWLFAPTVGAAIGYTMYRVTLAIVQGAGRGFIAFVQPSGKSTPYERTYSAHQAIAASGDYAEAFAAYDRTISQEPNNVEIRRQAAELHFRHGDPRKAEVLYLALRRIAVAGGGDELFATQRLVDLYLGSLGDDGRAMVELRRLIERFPATPEADGAKRALARLKEEGALPKNE